MDPPRRRKECSNDGLGFLLFMAINGMFMMTMAIATLFICDENGQSLSKIRERKRRRIVESIVVAFEENFGDSICRPRKKRKYICYNHQQGNEAVQEDFLGPTPIFDDKQFQTIFRVTKKVFAMILECVREQEFFNVRPVNCAGTPSLSPESKVLMGLKMMAYGVSANAFRDYYQMGKSTALLCYNKLAQAMLKSDYLRDYYLREMSASDARRVSEMHREVHGIPGMIGSLDCMHVAWKNCPVAYQGTFVGKEGHPTIVLEAIADYNLWIWHAAFGFPGSLNDISILQNSPLYRAFVDGSFDSRDFPFEIGDQQFNKLWMMTDGIYPELARFVKTLNFPAGRKERIYAKWQESCRKDVERAFGVLQRKYLVLRNPIEAWDEVKMRDVVLCCIMMHNMMVEERMEGMGDVMYGVDDGEDEYGLNLEEQTENNRRAIHTQIEQMRDDLRERLDFAETTGTVDAPAEEAMSLFHIRPMRNIVASHQWKLLNDPDEHNRLQKAIMDVLFQVMPTLDK